MIVGEEGLNEFPQIVSTPGQNITYKNDGVYRNILEIQNNRR